MDINFLPLFVLNLVEFEERLPSLRFALECRIDYMGSVIHFKNENLWVECDIWDRWCLHLSKIKMKESDSAILHDMDECFSVSIQRYKNESLEITFSNEINELDRPVTKLSSTSILSSDDLNRIIESTESFPIFW